MRLPYVSVLLLAISVLFQLVMQAFLIANVSDIASDATSALLTASAPELKNIDSSPLVGVYPGKQLVVASTIKNNDEINDWSFYNIIEVRDSNGVTIQLDWQSGTIKAGGEMEVQVSWTPELPGQYELRTFVISSFDNPRILSVVGTSSASIEGTADECDVSLWEHVYSPERLKIVDDCKTVTGVIEAISAENDGDYHVLVKLDRQYEDLVNLENIKHQKGDLVVETICQIPVTQRNAVSACLNFNAKHIDIPPVGSHVRVTGSYVLDLQHGGWAEIHPATSIVVLEEPPNSSSPPANQ